MQVRTYVDQELRVRPDSESELEGAIEKERETVTSLRRDVDAEPSELNKSHLGRELNRLADHLFLADELEEATQLKEEALDIWRDLDRQKAAFLSRLNLAEFHFEAGHHGRAFDILEMLLDQSASGDTEVYRDFVREVYGRCAFRAGRIDEALEALEDALDIRRERGNDQQVEQTEHMLEIVRDAD